MIVVTRRAGTYKTLVPIAHTLDVEGGQVGVLEERPVKSHRSSRRPWRWTFGVNIRAVAVSIRTAAGYDYLGRSRSVEEVLSDLMNKTLEGELTDEDFN